MAVRREDDDDDDDGGAIASTLFHSHSLLMAVVEHTAIKGNSFEDFWGEI
jgi:hypothetical protein